MVTTLVKTVATQGNLPHSSAGRMWAPLLFLSVFLHFGTPRLLSERRHSNLPWFPASKVSEDKSIPDTHNITQRAILQSDCTPLQSRYLTRVLQNEIHPMLVAAGRASISQGIYERLKFRQYFGGLDLDAREEVNNWLWELRLESLNIGQGRLKIYCREPTWAFSGCGLWDPYFGVANRFLRYAYLV